MITAFLIAQIALAFVVWFATVGYWLDHSGKKDRVMELKLWKQILLGFVPLLAPGFAIGAGIVTFLYSLVAD